MTLIFKSCGKLKRISRRKFWVLPHVKNILKRHRNSYLNFWEQTKNCQVSNYFCTLCTNRVVKSKFLSKNPFFGLEWLVLCIYRPNNLMFHLRTQYWGLRKPQKGSKWPIFKGLNQLHLSIMDLGFWVQMNPWNTFLSPLETSNGFKMALNWGFWALYTYWDAILAGSGLLLASKAYIHNGPWVLGPDLPLKHLFTTSGSLKKVLNHPQITPKLIFKVTGMHFWVALGDSLPPKLISMMDHRVWVQIYP